MNSVYQVLLIGLTQAELGVGRHPLIGGSDVELDIVAAPSAQSARALLTSAERWDLILCDAGRFFDLQIDQRMAESAAKLMASVVLLRGQGSQLSAADAGVRGCADVVTHGDREHLQMVAARELAAGAARKQLAKLRSAGGTGKEGIALARLRDFRDSAEEGHADIGADRPAPAPPSDTVEGPGPTHRAGMGAGRRQKETSSAVAEFLDTISVGGDDGMAVMPELTDDIVRQRIEAGGLMFEYQPIVALKGQPNEQAMFEVLLRLRNEHGLALPPRRFFPAVARNQWLGQLDLWVFRRALPILRRMQETKPIPTSFYINLSQDTLGEPNILDAILGTIADTLIRPGSLVVEVRKGCLDEADGLDRLVKQLTVQGHTLSLEEFAPEDCMLLDEYPGRFPQVKLNFATLEHALSDQEADKALRRAVLCAHNQGAKVIGMAVDNAPLLTRLYDLDVDFIQGHFVSMPHAQLVYPDLHKIEVEPNLPFAPLQARPANEPS